MSSIQIKKTIIYRPQKPILVFTKKETCNLRTKSAPPIHNDDTTKKFVLKRADGSLIKLEDLHLSDDDSSSDKEDELITQNLIINQIKVTKCLECTETRNKMLNTLIKNKTSSINENISMFSEQKKENYLYNNNSIGNTTTSNYSVPSNINNIDQNITSNKINETYDLSNFNLNYTDNSLKHGSFEKNKQTIYSKIYTPPKISDVKIVFSLQQIFDCKEEKPITFKLLNKPKKIKVSENYSDFVVKNETIKDKALFELNKLTRNNIKKIISNLRNLEISKADAKSIGSLIVFKAINEPQFCKEYAEVVHELKNLKSKEEKDSNIFFTTVIKDILSVLNKNINWEDTASYLKRENFKSTGAYERAYEEEEIKRYAMKKHTLGAIDFICNLYLLDAIQFEKIKLLIDLYRKNSSQDVVEVICKFIKNIGNKLDKYHSNYLQDIIKWLDLEKNKYDHRIKFMVQDVFEKRGASYIDNRKDFKTTFAYKNNIKNEIKQEDKNNYFIEIQDIKSIYQDLVDVNDEEDELFITDNFMMGSKTHGKIPFFTAYLYNCITNKKRSNVLIPFIVKNYDATNLNNNELFKILIMFKNDLEDLIIDAPVSEKNYIKLITLFKQKNIINQNDYNKLKTNRYKEIMKELNIELS